jgi:hypothetical protein
MRKLVACSAAGAALALATALGATAAKPVVTETQVNRTRVLAASPETCPFDFVIHTEGVRRDTVYSDGRVVTILHDFHVTYRASSSPTSASSSTSPTRATSTPRSGS